MDHQVLPCKKASRSTCIVVARRTMVDIQPSLQHKYSEEEPALSLQQLSITPAIQHQLINHLYNNPQYPTLPPPPSTKKP